jgi:hypothetical protein
MARVRRNRKRKGGVRTTKRKPVRKQTLAKRRNNIKYSRESNKGIFSKLQPLPHVV